MLTDRTMFEEAEKTRIHILKTGGEVRFEARLRSVSSVNLGVGV
jgi:hypothetical protein